MLELKPSGIQMEINRNGATTTLAHSLFIHLVPLMLMDSGLQVKYK